MREKLQNAPWWVWSLIQGVLFGTVMAFFYHQQPFGSWPAAIAGGLISGTMFGAVMGPVAARQRRNVSASAGDLPAGDLRLASRAVWRGPVPPDPDVRQAAARLAASQLNDFSRLRWFGLVFFALLTAASASFAFTDSPWWWAGAAVSAALVSLYAMGPRHLQRRIEILTG